MEASPQAREEMFPFPEETSETALQGAACTPVAQLHNQSGRVRIGLLMNLNSMVFRTMLTFWGQQKSVNPLVGIGAPAMVEHQKRT